MKDAMQSKYIFEDKLGISVRKLEGGAVEWHEIVKKILELQRSGEYRVAVHGQDIKDELVIAQRVMRRENFMIAFFNQDILDLTIPIPWKVGSRFRTKFYSKSIEWSIYYCVLSYMFNHKYQIRPAFCMDAASLQRRFIICGIAHVMFMPFLLFFLILHFFLQNLYDFRSSKQYLGPREWSNVAK
jgi:autophagy-related protein 9